MAELDVANFRRALVEAEMRPGIDGVTGLPPRNFVPRE
jgi:hypothetical protein